MSPSPLILLTNDDGVHAPGIKALAARLSNAKFSHFVGQPNPAKRRPRSSSHFLFGNREMHRDSRKELGE